MTDIVLDRAVNMEPRPLQLNSLEQLEPAFSRLTGSKPVIDAFRKIIPDNERDQDGFLYIISGASATGEKKYSSFYVTGYGGLDDKPSFSQLGIFPSEAAAKNALNPAKHKQLIISTDLKTLNEILHGDPAITKVIQKKVKITEGNVLWIMKRSKAINDFFAAISREAMIQ